MDDIEERIAAIVRHAIESGEIIEVSQEAQRLAAMQDAATEPDIPTEQEIAEAIADCAIAARVPLQVG